MYERVIRVKKSCFSSLHLFECSDNWVLQTDDFICNVQEPRKNHKKVEQTRNIPNKQVLINILHWTMILRNSSIDIYQHKPVKISLNMRKNPPLCYFSSRLSAGGESSDGGEEARRSGEGEDPRGGRTGVHHQEVPWCLWAAGQHQPGPAEEGEVRTQGHVHT